MTPLECKQIFAMLSEYLDRELPAGVCDEIGRHIDGCAPCVEFVKSLEKTVDLCRSAKNEIAPTPLPPETLARLKAAFLKL